MELYVYKKISKQAFINKTHLQVYSTENEMRSLVI